MDMKKGNQLDFNFPANDLLEFPRDLGEEGWFQFMRIVGMRLSVWKRNLEPR